MIKFERHSDCQLCPLYQSAKNPGLPTKSLEDSQIPSKNMAVLFVGQSPGFQEDEKGKIFIGYTGQLLDKMIIADQLKDYCDIYLGNACRCKPPQGGNETQSQIRTCRKYLQEDVAKLQAIYNEVIIVALGAKACYSVLNINSLNKTLKSQGKYSQFFGEQRSRVFATYHPEILRPTRKPGLIRAVETHFSLLLRYLKREYIPNGLKVEPEIDIDVPDILPAEVSLDIETYGILAGIEQTVFHPIKSKEIDGIPFKNQVVTVSFGWEDGGKIRTALYIFGLPNHRKKIREWFRKMTQHKIVCVGQNIKFDLLYLYFSGDSELPYWIDPRRLIVDDTMIWSFLLYEQQPEKGLKELSTLYGITDYSKAKITGKSGTAKSPWDKDLHYYNCLDSATTLMLRKDLKRRIFEQFGFDSPKLSSVCSWMRNAIIWDTFDLEKNGSAFNIPKVEKFHNKKQIHLKKIITSVLKVKDIKLAGAGSDAPLRQLMLDCLAEADLLSDPRVVWSDKTKKVSIGVENINLIKSYLRHGKLRSIVSIFQRYKEYSKIVSTYTKPLLENPRRGIVIRNGSIGLLFPSWYPIPTYSERGGSSDDKSGGQIQGRFSCKQPARQTEPKSIRKCSISRFCGGKIAEYDVNQDHLRMAALLSGDPILIGAYQKKGISIHTTTALTIFPDADPKDPRWKESDKYQTGKDLNFLVLFKGGGAAFQELILAHTGVVRELEFCERAIVTWYNTHPVYKEWQDSMIDLATRQGYLVLPTGWSRTFGIGQTNVAGQEGEICNFLHQTPCAQMLQSTHYRIKMRFLKYHIRSLICMQTYDSLTADIYPGEEQNVDEIVGEAMIHPPLLPVFENWVGRTIPWAYEKKEYKP